MLNPNLSFKHQEKSSRLWALLTIFAIKSVALIPHIIILYILQLASAVVMFIGLFAVLFIGRYPEGMANFLVGVYRWQWRMGTYLLCMQDKYPAFTMQENDDPSNVTFKNQETSSRLWAVLTIFGIKGVILIPHAIVLMVMGLVAGIFAFIGVFAVLFTGKYPVSFENWILMTMRYGLNVNFYYMCLTDKYPSFSWDDYKGEGGGSGEMKTPEAPKAPEEGSVDPM